MEPIPTSTADMANAIVRRIDGVSDIKVAFLNGPIATVIGYFEQKTDVTEAGARVDVRRTSIIEGPRHHRGAEGVAIAPVGGGGGLWRADLLVELETQKSCFHYHPAFRDDDVGDRFFDEQLDADPLGWIESRLEDLPSLLEEASAPDLTPMVDLHQHQRSIHFMMSLIESALARVPLARTAPQELLENV